MSSILTSTVDGVSYAGTACKDGFVYVAAGSVEYIGDGYQWIEDTSCWAWNGTSTWVVDTFGCAGKAA